MAHWLHLVMQHCTAEMVDVLRQVIHCPVENLVILSMSGIAEEYRSGTKAMGTTGRWTELSAKCRKHGAKTGGHKQRCKLYNGLPNCVWRPGKRVGRRCIGQWVLSQSQGRVLAPHGSQAFLPSGACIRQPSPSAKLISISFPFRYLCSMIRVECRQISPPQIPRTDLRLSPWSPGQDNSGGMVHSRYRARSRSSNFAFLRHQYIGHSPKDSKRRFRRHVLLVVIVQPLHGYELWCEAVGRK